MLDITKNLIRPRISIIICSHRRFDLLKIAIKSMTDQTSPKGTFEVIVVDNDNIINTEVINIVGSAKNIINIRYIHEPILGLSQARNTGGKAALAEYIGYMDDDAKAPENYIEMAILLIKNNNPEMIGGPYFPYYLKGKPKWFKDEYETGTSAEKSRKLIPGEFLNGTNMIFKKDILQSLNWFDTKYGMSGKALAYGEETDLQKRAWAKQKNLQVIYHKDLIIYHLANPLKLRIYDRLRRKYKLGQSQAYLWIDKKQIPNVQKTAPLKLIKTIALLLIKCLPGIVFRNQTKYKYWQNYVYEVLSNYFASIGQEWQYVKDRK